MLKRLRQRTPLGWRQLTHEKGRLLVAMAGIAFADVLMFMQMGFQGALYESNTTLHRKINADIVLMSPQARNVQTLSNFSRRRLFQSLDVPGVAAARSLYVGSVAWKNPQTRAESNIQVLGFEPTRSAFDLPELQAQLNVLKLPNTFVFDRGARGTYDQLIAGVEQGETVSAEVQRTTIKIGGLFQLGASFGFDATLVGSDQSFLRLFPRRQASSISLGLLELDPGAEPDAVAAVLEAHLTDDVLVLTKAEFIKFEQNYWQQSSPIGFIFGIGTAMAFVVGVVIVYQVLSTDVNAHLKEYATFKAMGYRQSYLLGVIIEESIILALLGFIPGVILPVGLYGLTRTATALPLYMTVARATTVFMLTVVMCLISGAIATRKLQAADPADMF